MARTLLAITVILAVCSTTLSSPPASAGVVSQARAGPGQSVVSSCSAFARDSTEYKQCVGGSGRRLLSDARAVATADARSSGSSSTVTSNANSQSSGPPSSAVSNAQGVAGPGQSVVVNCNAFARDSQQYKTCIGTPSTAVTFENAPACNTTSSCYAKDTQGRCWNWENGRSCAYKDASGKPLTEAQIKAGRSG